MKLNLEGKTYEFKTVKLNLLREFEMKIDKISIKIQIFELIILTY